MQFDILDIVKLAQSGNQEALSDVVGHVSGPNIPLGNAYVR